MCIRDRDKIEKLITAVEEELDDDAESIITDARYQYIGKLVKDCVKKKKTGLSTSDKIDHIVTNRILALPIFALIMWPVSYTHLHGGGRRSVGDRHGHRRAHAAGESRKRPYRGRGRAEVPCHSAHRG